VNAELAKGHTLELAVGRMILDPLHVSSETVALVKDRRVPVGKSCAIVEVASGECAEPVQMRRDVLPDFFRQMDLQDVLQRLICAEKVLPGGVRRDLGSLANLRTDALGLGRDVFSLGNFL
jgi:hypothetical protein